jgi:restriction system protein
MIPDFKQVLLPFLKVMADGKVRRMQELIDILSHTFRLSYEELQERHPHGQKIFSCLVRRARTEFNRAGLIEESTKYSYWRITQKGLNVVSENPDIINLRIFK